MTGTLRVNDTTECPETSGEQSETEMSKGRDEHGRRLWCLPEVDYNGIIIVGANTLDQGEQCNADGDSTQNNTPHTNPPILDSIDD